MEIDPEIIIQETPQFGTNVAEQTKVSEPPPEGRLIYEPSIDSVIKELNPPAAQHPVESRRSNEVVALITAVFDGVAAKVYDSHRRLCAQLAADHGENFWIVATQERMTFPEALLYGIGSAFVSEKKQKKRVDWFLWIEDDVSFPQDLFRQLRASADPEKRPCIGVVAYDRNQPFLPTVWGMKDGKLDRFTSLPDNGVLPVAQVGMTVMLIHRSLFDKIDQPWFGAGDSYLAEPSPGNFDIRRSIKPDMNWCRKLRDAKIPIYVNFDVRITHFGQRWPVNRETAQIMRGMNPFDIDHIRSYTWGEL